MLIRFYPNGEFRCVIARRSSVRQSDRNAVRRERRDRSPLVFPSKLSQPKRGKRSGRGPITRRALARIRHLGGGFRPENRERQVFCTGTLPGSTFRAVKEFSRLSGDFIKYLLTYLPRSLGLRAESLELLWVWEHQTRGALHAHLVVQCPDVEVAARLVEEWGSIWGGCLRAVSEKAAVDIFGRASGGTHKNNPGVWRVDAQICEKDASRYLSKYCSKGSQGFSAFRPSRWYGASRALRKSVAEWISSRACEIPCRLRAESTNSEVESRIRGVLDRLIVEGSKVVSIEHWYGGAVDLIGFFPREVDLKFIGGLILCEIVDLIESLDEPLPYGSPDGSVTAHFRVPKADRPRARRFLLALNRSPDWFQRRVRLNSPEYLRGEWRLESLGDEALFDLSHSVSSELYLLGYVGTAKGLPGWASDLLRAKYSNS